MNGDKHIRCTGTKPKEGKEFARMIALTNKNMKSGKYARDRVLRSVK